MKIYHFQSSSTQKYFFHKIQAMLQNGFGDFYRMSLRIFDVQVTKVTNFLQLGTFKMR